VHTSSEKDKPLTTFAKVENHDQMWQKGKRNVLSIGELNPGLQRDKLAY
jgi:hypothetical protein